MSDAEVASGYVRRLVERNATVGIDGAIRVVARAVDETFSSIWGLYHGRRKTAGDGLLRRLREAYVASLERDIAKLRAELQRERDIGCGDAEIAALANEIHAVAQKVQALRHRV